MAEPQNSPLEFKAESDASAYDQSESSGELFDLEEAIARGILPDEFG